MKIAFLLSVLNSSLFIQILFYLILLGNSVPCNSKSLRTASDCLKTHDGFNNGGQACYWDETSMTCLPNLLVRPISPFITLNIALISGLIMIVISKFLKFIALKISSSSNLKIQPISQNANENEPNSNEGTIFEATAQSEFVTVLLSSKSFRDSLKEEEKLIFDSYWQFEENYTSILNDEELLSKFMDDAEATSHLSNPNYKGVQLVAKKILASRKKAQREMNYIKTAHLTPFNQNFRLLHLLQLDMLSPYASGILFY
jgi:hypothetical protein